MIPKINIFSNNLSELETTKTVFKQQGYEVYTFSAVNQTNINSIYKTHPDVILLDLEVDNSDGIELCHQLKSENVLNSFIVLYAKDQEDYIQIEAFKAGADDYIIRPINPRLLLKKVEALLKRKPQKLQHDNRAKIVSYNKIKIDRDSYLVILDGKSISLPRKEFEMLYLLINTPKKVFSREEIFQKVGKENDCLNTRIIDVHIRKIREKIGENIIKTIKGIGYQLA